MVSEESYFKPHLTLTNVTLEVLLQEQLDVHKGKQGKYLSLKLYLCKKNRAFPFNTEKYKHYDMYFATYLAPLIDTTHKVIAAQETVWEHNTIQSNQMLELGM